MRTQSGDLVPQVGMSVKYKKAYNWLPAIISAVHDHDGQKQVDLVWFEQPSSSISEGVVSFDSGVRFESWVPHKRASMQSWPDQNVWLFPEEEE